MYCNKNALKTAIKTFIVISFPPAKRGPQNLTRVALVENSFLSTGGTSTGAPVCVSVCPRNFFQKKGLVIII
jgi:hypothetical protein